MVDRQSLLKPRNISSETWEMFFGLPYALEIMEYIVSRCKGVVIDIGAGPGIITCLIAKASAVVRVVWQDISGLYCVGLCEMMRLNNISNIRPITCDACNLGASIGDQTFDTVVAGEVLEHLVEKEWKLIVLEMKRVCKIGGSMIITVPDDGCMTPEQYEGHKYNFTREKFRQVAESLGEVVDLSIITGMFGTYRGIYQAVEIRRTGV